MRWRGSGATPRAKALDFGDRGLVAAERIGTSPRRSRILFGKCVPNWLVELLDWVSLHAEAVVASAMMCFLLLESYSSRCHRRLLQHVFDVISPARRRIIDHDGCDCDWPEVAQQMFKGSGSGMKTPDAASAHIEICSA